MNNVPYNPSNNLNILASNEQSNIQRINNDDLLIAVSIRQIEPVHREGLYNRRSFQPSPFPNEKPSGWFGTNRINWISNYDSELDKNKLAAKNHRLLN